jgi:DDE family transposase
MSSYRSSPESPGFRVVLQSFAQGPGLPFSEVLTAQHIATACVEEGIAFGAGPQDVYSVAVTLWAFLAQVLSKEKSCLAAVARVIAWLIALGRKPCSAATGAYCKARAKLSAGLLGRLTRGAGARLEDGAPAGWRWRGRRVLLADGTTVLLADTPANQAAYPQMPSQAPGVGFPIVRLVALLGWATGAVVAAALAPYSGKQTGETSLLRQLLGELRAGDVLVADRCYCTYWLVALAWLRGVDVVFRLHQRRHYDFRRGRRLGRDDHVVTWAKPARPGWMDAATYAGLPAELTVRELRLRIDRPGCRVKELVVATTLLSAVAYAAADVTDLYEQRWQAELDLRAIKSSLGMEMLRARSPAMARTELWAHLLAYNLVRQVMAQAAQRHGRTPRQVSFYGAVQTLNAFRAGLLAAAAAELRGLAEALWAAVVSHRVGGRPGRCEPRKVKRRWKTYGLLKKPRAEERAALLG